MTTSNTGVILIAHFESFSPVAYQDVADIWTIGYGTTRISGQPVVKGMTCTEDEARQYLATDLKAVESQLEKVCKGTVTQNQFDGLASLVYNIGIGNFQQSTILRKINSTGANTVTEDNFTSWNKARINGTLQPVNGLTRRRKSEYHLYTTGTLQFNF